MKKITTLLKPWGRIVALTLMMLVSFVSFAATPDVTTDDVSPENNTPTSTDGSKETYQIRYQQSDGTTWGEWKTIGNPYVLDDNYTSFQLRQTVLDDNGGSTVQYVKCDIALPLAGLSDGAVTFSSNKSDATTLSTNTSDAGKAKAIWIYDKEGQPTLLYLLQGYSASGRSMRLSYSLNSGNGWDNSATIYLKAGQTVQARREITVTNNSVSSTTKTVSPDGGIQYYYLDGTTNYNVTGTENKNVLLTTAPSHATTFTLVASGNDPYYKVTPSDKNISFAPITTYTYQYYANGKWYDFTTSFTVLPSTHFKLRRYPTKSKLSSSDKIENSEPQYLYIEGTTEKTLASGDKVTDFKYTLDSTKVDQYTSFTLNKAFKAYRVSVSGTNASLSVTGVSGNYFTLYFDKDYFDKNYPSAKIHVWNTSTTLTPGITLGNWGSRPTIKNLSVVNLDGKGYYQLQALTSGAVGFLLDLDGNGGENDTNRPSWYVNNKKVKDMQCNSIDAGTYFITVDGANSKMYASGSITYQIKLKDQAWKDLTGSTTIYGDDLNFVLRRVTTSDVGGKFYNYVSYNDENNYTIAFGTTYTTKLNDAEFNESEATTFTLPSSGNEFGYPLSYNAETGALVVTSNLDANNQEFAKYYFVSPEITGGKQIEFFRLTPARTRSGSGVTDSNSGGLSPYHFVVSLKDDDVKKLLTKAGLTTTTGTEVHYWIEDNKGNMYTPASSESDNVNLFDENSNGKRGNNNVYYNKGNVLTTGNGYTTESSLATAKTNGEPSKMFTLKVGDGVSYTWFLDVSNNNRILTQSTNKNSLTEAKVSTDLQTGEKAGTYSYYVIGNFNDQRLSGNWNPYDETGHRKMTRYVYHHSAPGIGVIDDTTDPSSIEDLDSVVYRITIARPAIGWSDMYLAIASADQVNKPSSSWIDGTNGDQNTKWAANEWFHIIRPESQWYGTDAGTSTTEAGMDLPAMRGGLYQTDLRYENNSWVGTEDNRSQSINPVIDLYGNASTFTLNVNMTTSTFRISFNSGKLYLDGPAVWNNSQNSDAVTHDVIVRTADSKGNITSTGTTATWYSIPYTYVAADKAFEHLDANGVEQPVVLHKNRAFRFEYDHDYTQPWFGEDDVVPTSMTDKSYVATGSKDETQYLNHVATFQSEDADVAFVGEQTPGSLTNAEHNIYFRLPAYANFYYIRLYLLSNAEGVPEYYYSIRQAMYMNDFESGDDADKDDKYDVRKKVFNGDRYFRMFSDYCAHALPEGVHQYVVDHVDEETGVAYVRQIDLDYIPAKVGVLLGSSTENLEYLYLWPYTDNLNATLPEGTNDLLKPAITKTTIKNVDPDGVHYNYVFFHSAWSGTGFFLPKESEANGGYVTSNNSCYLQTSIQPKAFGTDQKYTDPSGSAKANVFAWALVDEQAESTTTGIDTIKETSDTDNGAYYTLQGLKVARPNKAGIYIHNGKKIIVK